MQSTLGRHYKNSWIVKIKYDCHKEFKLERREETIEVFLIYNCLKIAKEPAMRLRLADCSKSVATAKDGSLAAFSLCCYSLSPVSAGSR